MEIIKAKLGSIAFHLALLGVLFFLLAAALIFYPELLLYIFVVSFFAISFVAFLVAVKVNHIKKNFNDLTSFFADFSGKKKSKKKI